MPNKITHYVGKLYTQARNGTLAEGFNQWRISDETGWSIAHQAAYFNTLPEGFTQWNLTNSDGKTVWDVIVDQMGYTNAMKKYFGGKNAK